MSPSEQRAELDGTPLLAAAKPVCRPQLCIPLPLSVKLHHLASAKAVQADPVQIRRQQTEASALAGRPYLEQPWVA